MAFIIATGIILRVVVFLFGAHVYGNNNMNRYRIFFEFLRKKLQIEISADSETAAVRKLRDKISIHKIEIVEDDTVDLLKNMFGMD